MKTLGISAAALLWTMGLGMNAKAATVVNVQWGGQSHSVATLTSAGTGVAFYGLESGSTTAPWPLALATIYAFMHESMSSGALSFGMIFTGADIATPNPTCVAAKGGDPALCRTHFQGRLSGASPASTVSVRDDPVNTFGDRDTAAPGANGFYALSPYTGATDGFMVDGVLPRTSLSMTAQTMAGFDSLVFVSGSTAELTFTPFAFHPGNADLTITLTEPFNANTPSTTVVPLPAGVILLVSAVWLMGILLQRNASTPA